MDEALLKARREFTPVPPQSRQSPGRVRSIPARLYVDRFVEHKEAFDFLSQVVEQDHGGGTKTLVRALLHYRDTVIKPLQKLREEDIEADIPPELAIAVTEFTVNKLIRKKESVKNVGARLYIDRFIEHRQAYHFLQEMQRVHSEGNKAIIRALLHYRDTVYIPLQKELDSVSAKSVTTQTRSRKKK